MKTDFLINFLKKLHPPTINLHFYQYFLQTGCLLRICLSFINNFYYSIQERYSCTRLKLHPTSGHFLAQSHGNYIALFSVNKPFKMNKAKRFEGHKVSSLFHMNLPYLLKPCRNAEDKCSFNHKQTLMPGLYKLSLAGMMRKHNVYIQPAYIYLLSPQKYDH